MPANTFEADTGNSYMYPKVLSLYETVIFIYVYPKVLSLYETVISIGVYPKVSSLYETVTYAMYYVVTLSGPPWSKRDLWHRPKRGLDICIYMLQRLYLPYRHAYLSIYPVICRQLICIMVSFMNYTMISHIHEYLLISCIHMRYLLSNSISLITMLLYFFIEPNYTYILFSFHILNLYLHLYIMKPIYSCSSMNLLYLEIGMIPIGSSKLKLWHFHAN